MPTRCAYGPLVAPRFARPSETPAGSTVQRRRRHARQRLSLADASVAETPQRKPQGTLFAELRGFVRYLITGKTGTDTLR